MKFYEHRFAEEYDRRLRRENYPGSLFDIVSGELPESSSVIDCGAGSGLFTIPLLLHNHSVIAVEPSAAMLDIMKRHLSADENFPPEKKERLKIIQSTWEDFSGPSATNCICIHALYGMKDPGEAVGKMKRFAERGVVIISDSSRKSGTLADKIRRSLPGKKAYRRNAIDMAEVLKERGFTFSRRKIQQNRISIFTDIDDETDYYLYHLKLPRENFSEVKEIIRQNSTLKNDAYHTELVYYDEIFTF